MPGNRVLASLEMAAVRSGMKDLRFEIPDLRSEIGNLRFGVFDWEF
jgi:hypothetical protein